MTEKQSGGAEPAAKEDNERRAGIPLPARYPEVTMRLNFTLLVVAMVIVLCLMSFITAQANGLPRTHEFVISNNASIDNFQCADSAGFVLLAEMYQRDIEHSWLEEIVHGFATPSFYPVNFRMTLHAIPAAHLDSMVSSLCPDSIRNQYPRDPMLHRRVVLSYDQSRLLADPRCLHSGVITPAIPVNRIAKICNSVEDVFHIDRLDSAHFDVSLIKTIYNLRDETRQELRYSKGRRDRKTQQIRYLRPLPRSEGALPPIFFYPGLSLLSIAALTSILRARRRHARI